MTIGQSQHASRRVQPEEEAIDRYDKMTQQYGRSKSVSNKRVMMGDPRWTSEWEPRTLHGYGSTSKGRSVAALVSQSRGRRMMSGPALRRVDPSPSTSRSSNDGHERPRPISTGRLSHPSNTRRQDVKDKEISAVARQQHREIHHQRSSSSMRSRDIKETPSRSPQTLASDPRDPASDSPRSGSTASVSKAFREMRERGKSRLVQHRLPRTDCDPSLW